MRALPCLVLCALLLAACYASNDVERSDDGTLALGGVELTDVVERGVVPGARTLVFDGFSGTITLRGTDETEARLRFTKKGRGDDADAAREALAEITLEESGDDATYRYGFRSGDDTHTSVEVEGSVPRVTRLDIRLPDGHVVVGQVTAALKIRVENGSIQVTGAASDVEARVQNGNLTIGMAHLPAERSVDAATQNGQVQLGLPAGAGARIEATTAVGTVRAADLTFRSQRLDPQGAGARFRATMGSGAARVSLSTQNGSIELRDTERLTVVSAVPPAARATPAPSEQNPRP